MAAQFPLTIPVYNNPTSGNLLSDPSVLHTLEHSDVNDDVIALATKVGTGLATPGTNKVLWSASGGTSTWTDTPTLAGLTLTGNFNVGGNLIVTGTITSGGVLTASVGITVTTGGLTVSAGGIIATGNSLITGSLGVSSNITASAGTVTGANGLIATTGGVTISAGNLTFGAAAAKILPGATSIAFWNSAGTNANLTILDAGGITTRSSITMGGNLIVGANTLNLASSTVSGQPTWSSSQTIPGLTVSSGNLTFSSTGQRVSADMGNATWTNRLIFQNSTAGGNTSVMAMPNGAGTISEFLALSTNDPANAAYVIFSAHNSSGAIIDSNKVGTGTAQNLLVKVAGTTILTLTSGGGVQAGAPTLGDQGAGTGNFTGLFINGVAVGTTGGAIAFQNAGDNGKKFQRVTSGSVTTSSSFGYANYGDIAISWPSTFGGTPTAVTNGVATGGLMIGGEVRSLSTTGASVRAVGASATDAGTFNTWAIG